MGGCSVNLLKLDDEFEKKKLIILLTAQCLCNVRSETMRISAKELIEYFKIVVCDNGKRKGLSL